MYVHTLTLDALSNNYYTLLPAQVPVILAANLNINNLCGNYVSLGASKETGLYYYM